MKGKRVLVIGLGLSGLAAVQFLRKRGAIVTGVDKNPDKVANLEQFGACGITEGGLIDVNEFDLVVVSPGIPTTYPLYKGAIESQVEIIGEVELACRETTKKCLGITGTNGKTTVTLLTTHVLNHSGIKALALGNVGTPLTAAVDDLTGQEADVFVVELSSFQLETLHARFLHSGVILNITPDHLDRYGSMEAYARAKINISKLIQEGESLFVEESCLKFFPDLFKSINYLSYGYSPESAIYSDTKSVYVNRKPVFTLPVEYRKVSHDLENMMASFALCSQLGVSPESFLNALKTFKKPSHRIEFVRTLSGVRFYDDSKGTNIDAVVRAVHAIEGNIILIAGGVDKGSPYTPWIQAFGNKVKSIYAIGQAAEKIEQDLSASIPVERFKTLAEAVTKAAHLAKEGEVVLLSPGCSSFDMFKDYAHRGEEFQRIVNAL